MFSNIEKLRAQGSSEKFDLVASKVNNAKNSLFAVLNRQFYGDGTGNAGKDIGDLGLLVPTSPLTGVVGGINRATFSFWRSRYKDATKTSTTYDNLRASMRTLYNDCSRGAYEEHPEFFVFDQTTFQAFEGTIVANERFTDGGKSGIADGGFKNEMLKFKGCKVAFDEDMAANTGFCLNTRNLKFNYPKGGWAKTFPTVEPANQTAEVIRIATVGNMSINNPRRLGKLYNAAS